MAHPGKVLLAQAMGWSDNFLPLTVSRSVSTDDSTGPFFVDVLAGIPYRRGKQVGSHETDTVFRDMSMTGEDFLKMLDRRTFLKILSFTGISGLVYPRRVISSLASLPSSRLVVVEEDSATNGATISSKVVQVMIDSGIRVFAQKEDVGAAWMSLMPDLGPASVIAIKVNGINPSMPTHPQVTYAVVESLKKISFDGEPFAENNVIIFDRGEPSLSRSRYVLNSSSTGVRCIETPTVGYSSETYDVGGRSQRLSKIITEMADYMINISVLKNHGIAGATLCLKNHYGTCDRPGALHSGHGDSYIGALNALDPIREKQCLNICDALLGIRSGGPGGVPQFAANKLVIGQDIVAVDYWGRTLLEENDCTTLAAASHIDTATARYGLGTNDPLQMEVVEVANPTVNPPTAVESSQVNSSSPEFFQLVQNYPNPFNGQTQVRFHVPGPVDAGVTVYNSGGQRVRSLVRGRLGGGWHQVAWDGTDDGGRKVASGIYICQLEGGGFRKGIIMQFLK